MLVTSRHCIVLFLFNFLVFSAESHATQVNMNVNYTHHNLLMRCEAEYSSGNLEERVAKGDFHGDYRENIDFILDLSDRTDEVKMYFEVFETLELLNTHEGNTCVVNQHRNLTYRIYDPDIETRDLTLMAVPHIDFFQPVFQGVKDFVHPYNDRSRIEVEILIDRSVGFGQYSYWDRLLNLSFILDLNACENLSIPNRSKLKGYPFCTEEEIMLGLF